MDVPVDQLPLDAVEQGLAPYAESLRFTTEATRCRFCNWPEWKPGMNLPNLSGYRRLAFAIRIRVKLEIAKGGCEGAISVLQTGFGMGKHLAQGPTIIQALVGIAIDAVMCREVEECVQRQDAPNLGVAISGMPKAFTWIEKVIAAEAKAAGRGSTAQAQVDVAEDRCRVIAKMLDRDLAILQCVEAIRSYAADHGGRLPAALTDITGVPVPLDPQHDGPFQYSLSGSTATLESAPPAGGSDKERTRYEISIRN